MRAKPVRMLLPPGLVLLLVVGAGWSLAQAHGAKSPAHKPAKPTKPARPVKPARLAKPARPAKPAKRARAASSAPAVTTHPPASVNLSAGWRAVPDPSNLGVAEDWGQGGGEAQPWQSVEMPNDFNANIAGAPNSGTVAW